MSNLNKLSSLEQFAFYDSLRGQIPKQAYFSTSIAIAYVYYVAFQLYGDSAMNYDLMTVLEHVEDNDIKDFLARKLNGIDYAQAQTVFLLNDEASMAEHILNMDNERPFSDYPTTVSSVLELVNRILDIKDGEEVFSVGLDLTSFINNKSNYSKKINYTYSDINVDNTAIAKIKLEILNKYNEFSKMVSVVKNGNFMFIENTKQYDKSFSHMPFNVRVSSYDYEDFKKTMPILNAFKKSNTLDWPFMLKLVQGIKDGGKAVSLSFVGTTYNLNDREFRKYFIEKGYIEAVITLPGRLLSDTAVQTALYVFSHNNSSVKLIDATNIYEAGRRQNILTEENISTIFSAYKNNVERFGVVLTKEELAENDFALIPSRYLNTISYSNGVPLKDIISIRRGASLRADNLDELSTIEHTDYQYLMLADINNGIINEDLSFITHIDESLTNFIIREENLVLSKIGVPFKVAIMDKRETEILANGNLYILEADNTKVDPYYLQAFLQSDEGQKLLASVATGATFASISIKDLMELEIPLPPLEEQKIKGKVYKEALNEIINLSKKLEKTKTKIASLFDNKWVKKDVK